MSAISQALIFVACAGATVTFVLTDHTGYALVFAILCFLVTA